MTAAFPMKPLVILLVFFCYNNVSAQTDTWTLKKPFGYGPILSGDGVAFSLNGKAYVGLGYSGEPRRDLWEYDTARKAWSQKAAFPGPALVSAAYFSIGNTGYTATGYHQFGQTTNEVWAYHADINSWEAKRNFPGTARSDAFAFSIGGKGYVGGGSSFKDFWQYDPVSDSWSQKSDVPGNNIYRAAALSINENGYLLVANKLWLYNPNIDKWTQRSAYPGSENSTAVALEISGKGYIGVGETKEFWQYDPNADSWERQPDYPGEMIFRGYLEFTIADKGYVAGDWLWKYDPQAKSWNSEAQVGAVGRFAAAGFSIGNKGYLGTGSFWLTNQKDFWEYNPLTDTWTQKANFPGTARYGAVGFAIGTKGYLGLGYDGTDTRVSYPNDFWQYDPIKNTWKKISDFPGAPRQGAAAVTMKNKGYVGTGHFESFGLVEILKDFWEYNAETNSWMRKADFVGSGRMHPAAFAIDNKCYLGTGFTDGELRVDFWEYDLIRDTWSRKADYPGGGRQTAAAFSVGNRGFIGLGLSIAGRENELWEYNPFNDSWVRKRDFPGDPRHTLVSFSIGKKGYIGTGLSGNPPYLYNDFWEYSSDNEVPVANGWLMKYYTPTSVLMNGWGSYDPEGGPIKFWWEKIAGPSSYTMLYQNSSTPVISNLINGTYTFRLTVTDDMGATATSDVTFTVKTNLPPVANGWVMKYYTPTSVLMNAWGSYDPEGGPVKFWWEKISGPSSFTMLYQNASTPVISNLTIGEYKFQLTVTDNEGAAGKDTVTININSLTKINERNAIALNEVGGSNSLISLSIFPNPASETLTYGWTDAYSGYAQVSVIDLSGKILKRINIKKAGNKYNGEIALTGMKAGLYYLLIKKEDGKSHVKEFFKK